MISFVALILFIGLVGFIAFLYIRRKKIEGEMSDLYTKHSLYTTTDEPPNVRESLGASDNLYCCRANLTTAKGANIELCWWEWFIKTTTTVNNVPTAGFTYYLAVSFARNAVSDEFKRQIIRLADKSRNSAAQKVKDFFITNTETPYRAEILADGTLLVCWHIFKRRKLYEAKIEWLKNNAAPPNMSENALTANIHIELKPTETVVMKETAVKKFNEAESAEWLREKSIR